MTNHENVLVFSAGATIHAGQSKPPQRSGPDRQLRSAETIVGYRPSRQKPPAREFIGYPNSVLEFSVDKLGLHPTAKPIALLEFLIQTYTRSGEIVLDCAMGTGSTEIAAANTACQFIGIEKDAKFFRIAIEVLRGLGRASA
jgi:site-specific DNA-methyltransferase (adenine-specific)